MDMIKTLAQEFSLQAWQIENVIKLIDDGNTIPFIARYRKEQHGELNDQVLRELHDRLNYLRSLDQRREEICASLQKQGVYTDELTQMLAKCVSLAELEDVYRPYKPKRRTRASIARERGLEPLSVLMLLQGKDVDPKEAAMAYVESEKGVETPEDALQGAMDILAENISDDAGVRTRLREYIKKTGVIRTKVTADDEGVYGMYKDYTEPASNMPGHRILAIDRGEREGILKVELEVPEEQALSLTEKDSVRPGSPMTQYVKKAAQDAYNRLIAPSMARETRTMLTERAQEAAIKVFATNLNDLLMQPPVRDNVVLGMDPGIRTGCKLAVVDQTGKVLDTGVIYPLPMHGKVEAAKRTVRTLIKEHNITLSSIGNGTASRETEQFFVDTVQEAKLKTPYVIVNEAGASVYSASRLAAEEFPQYDVSLRSAVSIARRLQDPLAELVKIDPKSIGVGQYQHDMKPARLDEALGGVVERCVNQVGVDLNTASPSLLEHIAGVSKALAQNIVKFREENGRFLDRSQLKKVPKLGPKAFEQCAGFLRIADGKNPLDATGVHPESYKSAQKLLEEFGFTPASIKNGALTELGDRVGEVGTRTLAMKLNIGAPTLRDMVKELMKPGRDPRDELSGPILRTDILEMKDLLPGMELKGTVRNVVDFGAFVDIGVHRDGLVHTSQISERRIAHPSDVLHVGDLVTVWVQEVDIKKNRIALTMKKPGRPD
ncbi:MAG: Tex family protein [Clostridia bacterium]